MDPYKILGVDKTASNDEIKAAYRKLVAKYHPDAGGDSWAFQLVQDAFDELTGQSKKSHKPQGKSTDTGSQKKPKKKSTKSDSDAKKKNKKQPDEFEFETPDPTAGFYSAKRTSQKTTRKRKNSKSRKTLVNVVGVIGGGVCALIVAWLIIGSTWFQDLRVSLSKTAQVVPEIVEPEFEEKSDPDSSGLINVPFILPPKSDRNSDRQFESHSNENDKSGHKDNVNDRRETQPLDSEKSKPKETSNLSKPEENENPLEPPSQPDLVPPPALAPFDSEAARRLQQAWAKHLGVPVLYKNSIGMEFVLIPPGGFEMGDNNIETSKPQHPVVITQPYYLGKHEVTQAEFSRITKRNPSSFGPEGSQFELLDNREKASSSRFPVEFITWDEANNFCELLERENLENKRGAKYRLPTEAEWEYACRAGSETAFYFGDDVSELKDYGWFDQNSGDNEEKKFGNLKNATPNQLKKYRKDLRNNRNHPHPVGSKLPNQWGLFDMTGNVCEWCSDWYAPDYYNRSDKEDPQGPTTGSVRVIRNGAALSPNLLLRSANRFGAKHPKADYLGFRVVLEIPN